MHEKITPARMRDLIDNLIKQHGLKNVQTTVESIFKFYEKGEKHE